MEDYGNSMKKIAKFRKNFDFGIDIYRILCYNNYVVKQQRLNIMWRSRVVGRARATGNRVTTKNSSRVRISPSPPKQRTDFIGPFVLEEMRADKISASCESAMRRGHTFQLRILIVRRINIGATCKEARSDSLFELSASSLQNHNKWHHPLSII